MSDRYRAILESLGFEMSDECDPPTETRVKKFERQFAVKLPADFRAFLVLHGGVTGDATCAFLEPTPCGTETSINSFYGFSDDDSTENIVASTDLIEGAPDVIALGDNQMGGMFWLKCTGTDAGSVYLHDHEGRSAWPDEQFQQWFPNLDSTIKEYLALRKKGKLPKKPRGYEHVYLVGRTFDAFIKSLRKDEA